MTMTITAQSRDTKAHLDALRAEGLVPAVYYGQGNDAVAITVNKQEMIKLWQDAGSSSIVDLQTPAGLQKALIQDIQIHAVTQVLLHVDFKIVDMTKPIEIAVPLNFIGEAPAEKYGLGMLNTAMDEIEIRVPASDLPQHIDVDISTLVTLDDAIYASDIAIPASAELITDPEILVVKVSEQKEDEEGGEMNLDAIASATGNKKEEAK